MASRRQVFGLDQAQGFVDGLADVALLGGSAQGFPSALFGLCGSG
jgi:hypothetical protein